MFRADMQGPGRGKNARVGTLAAPVTTNQTPAGTTHFIRNPVPAKAGNIFGNPA